MFTEQYQRIWYVFKKQTCRRTKIEKKALMGFLFFPELLY